jgi:hydroxymethylpyrimidine pyrophosphatase-like HAD family hydrolase
VHPDKERIRALDAFLHAHPLADEFDFVSSESSVYEILPKGMSKGGALRKMTELYGIDPRRTIAIGDYDNDVSMLREAALGVAVANANANAKAAADLITVSNDEHAIATVIGMLDRGEIVL